MTSEIPAVDAPLPDLPHPVHAPMPVDPRHRLRELLRVSERDRSDAQWDEINELEIQMAPGNRISPHGSPHGGDRPASSNKRPPQRSRGGGGDRGGNSGGGGSGDRRPQKKPRPPQSSPPQ